MSENELIDTSSTSIIIRKDNKWVIKKVVLVKRFNEILRKWQKKSEATEYLPLNSWNPPLKKEVETQIIFRRSAVDTFTLKPLTALFTQKIRARALKDNEHEFLNVCEGQIFLHFLDTRITQPLGLRDRRIQRVGKPKRISLEVAQKLLKEGCRIYEESPTGELAIRFNA